MNWFQHCSNEAEIKTAYRIYAKQLHPDVGGDTATMQEINAQYESALKGDYARQGFDAEKTAARWDLDKEIMQKAQEILKIKAVINMIPEGETSVKLDAGNQAGGGAIMALHCEKIGERRNGSFYSFAHYYEQNGDLMRDPDVVMLRTSTTIRIIDGVNDQSPVERTVISFIPTSYRQDSLGIDREYIIFEDSESNRYRIAARMQADLVGFCNGWARNIREQQDIETPKQESAR